MPDYPPTDQCPGCHQSVKFCTCGKPRSAAAILAQSHRHSAHLHGAPGINWADTLPLTIMGANA